MNDIFSVLSLTSAGEMILTVTGKDDSGNSLILAKKTGASVTNMMTDVIKPVIKEVLERYGIIIREVTVALSSVFISISQNRGYIVRDIADEEINEFDLTTLTNFILQITPPPGMGIVAVASLIYTVDDEGRILSPIGMCGKRLECTYKVLFAEKMLTDSIKGELSSEGVRVKKFIPGTSGTPEPFLTQDEMESLSVWVNPFEDNERYFIFNTNISNDEVDHEDMLANHKVAAYFDPWKYKIERLSIGDVVFLYQSGFGIVAMGKADGKLVKASYQGNPDHAEEEYSMSLIDFHRIEPAVTAAEIKRITGTDHVFRQTMISLYSVDGKNIFRFIAENGRIKD